MISERPDRPSERAPRKRLERNDARARARQLRDEAALTHDRTEKAWLLYEAGYLNEILLHQPAQAVQDYLSAYNADQRLRLPLVALVRMFERRRSYKNLLRLYDAELRTARAPQEIGTALTDQAVLGALAGEPRVLAVNQLERALAQESCGEAALLLEWHYRGEGDTRGAQRALTKRVEHCDAPALRGAMLIELALAREARGELEGALTALRMAALDPAAVPEAYPAALARFARKHGFTLELVEANERRAETLRIELAQLAPGDVGDPALRATLRDQALACWYEASRLRCTSLADPLGALRSLDAALGLAPDDPALRQLRMSAYDLLEDRERAATEATWLLDAGLDGPQAASLHFRLAEHHLVRGDAEQARKKLVETVRVAGRSVAAEAILDDLLLDEQRHEDRIAQREAQIGDDAARAHVLDALGEAAQIAAQELRDAERARALFGRADALAPGDRQLLMEAYGSALALNDDQLARFAISRLLKLELDVDEHAALLHHRFELADDDERRAMVTEPADAPVTHVLKLAVTHAAERRDYPLLGRAHEALALATRTMNDDESTAELCAAARAFLRADDPARARALLEQALERAPAQPYALTLLEEVLRDQGDAEAAIALLRRAASQHESVLSAELHLLSAAAAAEAAGDVELAAESYVEAASTHGSRSALWALYRLAERRGDRALERRAREELANRERAEGRVGVDTLLLAEHYDLSDDDPSRAAALLRAVLDDVDVGHHAAVGIVISRGAPLELRERALELLATRATDSLRPALLRELGGELVALGSYAPRRVLELAERVRLGRPEDRWAAFTRTHAALPLGAESQAAALETFAEVTTDPVIADCARAEALWARQLSAPDRPIDEALSAVLPPGDRPGMQLAEAVVRLASPAHDGAQRIEALDVLARGTEPEGRPRRLLALARARLAENDAAGAVTCLEEVLPHKPDWVAGWELAYEAARRADRPSLQADAAEKLAAYLEDDEQLALLEESAALRMDVLDDAPGAIRLLTRVLARAPLRTEAYVRLRELYGRDATPDRACALIRERAQSLDDADELVRLYFELARLERLRSDLVKARNALENVLLLDEQHVGALALAAEMHGTRGEFREAVDMLDRLVAAPHLPAPQRRTAGLAAADFLENKLDDRGGALARLERVLPLAPADLALQLRVADVAERHGSFARAGEALAAALALDRPDDQGVLALRYANLLAQKLDRPDDAATWYRRALAAAPDNIDAARALLAIADEPSLVPRIEEALRERARKTPDEPGPLHALAELATLANDDELSFLALSALHALGAGDEGERARWPALRERAHKQPLQSGVALAASDLRPLLAPHLDGPVEQLLQTMAELTPESEPGQFGVGRGQRISARDPHPVRDQVATLALALGMKIGDTYVGGSNPTRITVLPRADDLTLIIGDSVAAPLSIETRARVSLQLAAAHHRLLPLLSTGPAETARMVHAALVAVGLPLPKGVQPEQLGDLPRAVGRMLTRKARRALPELAQALPDGGVDLEAQCRAALVRVRRLALLLTSDLAASCREARDDREAERDLYRTWMSAPLRDLRRKLGLAL